MIKLTPYSPSQYKVEADIKKEAKSLVCNFFVKGEMSTLDLTTPKSENKRLDNLWKFTCFEFFLKNKKQKSYIEFNANLSSQWNLYHFDDYRIGMKEHQYDYNPKVYHHLEKDSLSIDISLPFFDDSYNFGTLTCILIDNTGKQNFFAPMHADLKPNFHDQKSFIDLKL